MSKTSMRSESTSFHQSAFAGASACARQRSCSLRHHTKSDRRGLLRRASRGRVVHKDPFITSAGGSKSYVYDTCQVRRPLCALARALFRAPRRLSPFHVCSYCLRAPTAWLRSAGASPPGLTCPSACTAGTHSGPGLARFVRFKERKAERKPSYFGVQPPGVPAPGGRPLGGRSC